MGDTVLKPLLSSEDLIEHMEQRGIKFEQISKSNAVAFLISNNNYFKLTSYRKNFPKFTEGDRKGQYIDLDFAYLIDLSTIDMHLRHLLLKMTLDIEHYIKVNLLQQIENNISEDGYLLVKEFIDSFTEVNGSNKIITDIKKNAGSPYCGELLEKHNISSGSNMIEQFPIWAFVEVISFGNLRSFYQFYLNKYNVEDKSDIGFLLKTVNQLRNAVAHSNCIINNLYPSHPGIVHFYKPNYKVMKFLSNAGIEKTMRTTKMKNPRLKQIVTVLYVFDKSITSKIVKKHRYEELNELVSVRMKRNKSYYIKNPTVASAYEFVERISRYLHKTASENL